MVQSILEKVCYFCLVYGSSGGTLVIERKVLKWWPNVTKPFPCSCRQTYKKYSLQKQMELLLITGYIFFCSHFIICAFQNFLSLMVQNIQVSNGNIVIVICSCAHFIS